MEKEKPHYHGHRERLRARFLAAGFAGLADYEIIELLLTLAIPRADVKVSEHLAKRLAAIPNICGFKQAGPAPAATISLREAVGNDLVVSVADETPWLHNLSVMGDRWLLNYCPHLYQVPGYLPVRDYTQAALAGDMNRAAEICRSVNPVRALDAKWIAGYGLPTGRVPSAEMRYWMELIGMVGGPVRAPCIEMTEQAKKRLRADIEATGLPAKAKAGAAGSARRRTA